MRNNGLQITTLGELKLAVDGELVPLPKSRKARALFAYLAAVEKPVSRNWLSHFLFDDTADPKGNLRWCLSRLKSAISSVEPSLICSDAERVWLDCDVNAIDVHRIATYSQQENFSDSEFELFADVIQRPFLENLCLSKASEYEAWRATQQSYVISVLETALDRAANCCLGTELGVQFAHLLVKHAPHSERAWFLLVSALAKTKQTVAAQDFLDIAHEQLKKSRVLHTGLLAMVANELQIEANTQHGLVASHDYASPATQKPTIGLQWDSGDSDALRAQFEPPIRAALGVDKNFTLIAMQESVSQATADFMIVPAVSVHHETYQLDLQLLERRSNGCVWTWQVELQRKGSDALDRTLRRWLGQRLELDIPLAMFKLARVKPETELSAADYYYLALPRIHSPVGYSASDALRLLQKSLQLDANFGPALCATAWVRATHRYYNEVDHERAQSAKLARRAIELSSDDASILGWAGINVAHLEGNVDIGLRFAERALSLNAFSPLAVLLAALMQHYSGNYDESLAHLAKLDGADIEPLTFLADSCYALNYYQSDRLSEAIDHARKAVNRNPKYNLALRALAASLFRAGQTTEASVIAARMCELNTGEFIQHYEKYALYSNPAALQKLCEDLAAAGVPSAPYLRNQQPS